MAEEADWLSKVASSPRPGSNPVDRTKINTAETLSNRKTDFPKQYKMNFDEVVDVKRLTSSLLPDGYSEGGFIALTGPPGAGKSRLCIQEAIHFNNQGYDVLYMYNESIRSKFDAFVKKVCLDMNINDASRLKNISWIDMSDQILKVADYDTISLFIKKRWVQQVRYWIENNAKNPGLVVIDSFSRIGRRYIPQMWVVIEDLTDDLAELFTEKNVYPTVLTVHQKSQSSREKNDDTTVGGFGITHTADATIVMKLQDVTKWEADRYGLPEGSRIHSIQIMKDRYASSDFSERIVILENGRLKLGPPINDLTEKVKHMKENKFSKRSTSTGEAITVDDVEWADT